MPDSTVLSCFAAIVVSVALIAALVWVVLRLRFVTAKRRLIQHAQRLDVGNTSPDELIVHGRSLTEIDPGDWRGWYELGKGYRAKHDHQRAHECMRWAIKIADLDAVPPATP